MTSWHCLAYVYLQQSLVRLARRNLADQFSNLLRVVFMRNKRSVIRLHNDAIPQADYSNGGALLFCARIKNHIPSSINVD